MAEPTPEKVCTLLMRSVYIDCRSSTNHVTHAATYAHSSNAAIIIPSVTVVIVFPSLCVNYVRKLEVKLYERKSSAPAALVS
jgi:hypothetical protein